MERERSSARTGAFQSISRKCRLLHHPAINRQSLQFHHQACGLIRPDAIAQAQVILRFEPEYISHPAATRSGAEPLGRSKTAIAEPQALRRLWKDRQGYLRGRYVQGGAKKVLISPLRRYTVRGAPVRLSTFSICTPPSQAWVMRELDMAPEADITTKVRVGALTHRPSHVLDPLRHIAVLGCAGADAPSLERGHELR